MLEMSTANHVTLITIEPNSCGRTHLIKRDIIYNEIKLQAGNVNKNIYKSSKRSIHQDSKGPTHNKRGTTGGDVRRRQQIANLIQPLYLR